METPGLSIRECLRFGWTTFKKRPWILVGATALVSAVSMLIPDIEPKQHGWALAIAVGVMSFMVTTLMELGMANFALKAHDNVEGVTLKYLWRPELFWKYLGTSLLALLIVVVGLVLLIIPGIIAALMLCFSTYLVVDRGMLPVAALKESRRLTKGHRWKLLGLFGMIALLNILGLVALLVGLLVSIPVTALAFVHAYRTLTALNPAENESVVVPEETGPPVEAAIA
jgi:uncharacterized membrane protein